MSRVAVLTLAAALFAAPAAFAQSTPPTDQAPASPPAGTGSNPAVSSAPADATNPNTTLGVASVTVKNGWRASKLIGSSVYNGQNQQVGSIDDLILTPGNKVTTAIIQVGGFLGMGGKLVAVPFDRLQHQTSNGTTHMVLSGATKDALNAMPSFTYGNS